MPRLLDIRIPDIGDADEVEIIEITLGVGDSVSVGDVLLTVESDKAAMDIPSVATGQIAEVLVATGARVKRGLVFARIEVSEVVDPDPAHSGVVDPSQARLEPVREPAAPISVSRETQSSALSSSLTGGASVNWAPAGPASRRLARELGINIGEVPGSGRRGRIHKEDVKKYAKSLLTVTEIKTAAPVLSMEKLPDLSKFGSTHSESLNKVELTTSRNMQRAWCEVPHAWLQQRIDITDLEEGRKRLKTENPDVSLTALVIKSVALALRKYPRFNTVLDTHAQQIVYRHYVNVGVAVDTPRGLVIAVLRDCDKLAIAAIGAELTRLSSLAREGKLHLSDMQGACMTVSSLGGLGIDGLQPIVNWPEVAILGVARASMQPVYIGGCFSPRLILPTTLGFDHRVINGADGARFLGYIQSLLGDPMRLLVNS